MSWAFRVRFKVAGRSALSSESNKLRLTGAVEVPAVYLQPWNDPEGALKDARDILLTSQGYASEDDATDAGHAWLTALQAICVRHQIGVDFGDGSQRSNVGATPTAQAFREGRQILADNLGLEIYRDDAPTTFHGFSASGVAIMHTESVLQRDVQKLVRAELDLKDCVRLACGLFGASFFQPSSDARFLLLMMALESLIQPEDHPAHVQVHVAALIQQTQDAEHLSPNVRSSLVDSLEWLKQESIGRAGRRAVSILGAKLYDGRKPKKFFTECYDVGSRMVHGNEERPNRRQVDQWAAHLEVMVRDLIELQVVPGGST